MAEPPCKPGWTRTASVVSCEALDPTHGHRDQVDVGDDAAAVVSEGSDENVEGPEAAASAPAAAGRDARAAADDAGALESGTLHPVKLRARGALPRPPRAGRWSQAEHARFVDGLQKYGRRAGPASAETKKVGPGVSSADLAHLLPRRAAPPQASGSASPSTWARGR